MADKFLDQQGLQTLHTFIQDDINHHHDSTKQNVISDLDTIRSGASAGATAIQQNDLEAYHDDTKQDTINDLDTIRSGATAGTTAVQPEDIIWASNDDIRKLFPKYPIKGQIISMNLDGTTRSYRVLSISGTVAKVLSMFDSSASQVFNNPSKKVQFSDGTTAQQYMDSDLDTYLNETWYDTLTVNAKAAIVEQNRTQDLWFFNSTGNPVFHRERYDGGSISDCSKGTGTSPIGNRKVFALSLQEVFDYLELSSGDTMTWKSVFKMFWNDEDPHPSDYVWFSSSAFGGPHDLSNPPDCGFIIYGSNGYFEVSGATGGHPIRPALALDLSKIDFTIEGGNN